MMSGGGLTDLGSTNLWALEDWANCLRPENPLLADMLKDLYDLLRTYDYYLAGDYGSDKVEKDWTAFRDKWMVKDFDKMKQVLMERCIEVIESARKGFVDEN